MSVCVLPYDMFDDGTLQYRTFCVATPEDAQVVEFDYIKKHFCQDTIKRIEKAMAEGKHHIACAGLKGYFEIQWD